MKINKKKVKEWTDAFIEAVIIVGILYFVFFPVKIEGISMEGTLFNNDRVAVSKVMTALNLYNRGDIIVFEHMLDGIESKFVKRVIAIENDHVVIENGEVFVNGTYLKEDYVEGITYGELDIIVDKDSIFVLGDNRQYSTDSRDFGTISRDKIEGRVIVRFYPFNNIEVF